MRARGLWLLVALSLCATPASAQDSGWKLEDTTQRYELDLQAPPFKIPGGVEIPKTFVVNETSFKNGRLPAFPLKDPGDLVWYYILALPEGELKNRRTVPVDDAFPAKGGKLYVKGERKLKRSGKKLTVTSELKLTTDVPGSPITKDGADLTIKSVFDLKRGLMREATMKLVAPVVVAGQPGKLRWGGVAKLVQQLEVGKKSFHVQVEKAIDKGKNWLLGQTKARLGAYRSNAVKGSQLQGRMALPCFALLRSGVEAKKLKGEFEWMAQQPLDQTYSVSLWIMALEALSVQRQKIAPRDGTRSVARFDRGEVAARNKELMAAATQWLVENRKAGAWNYKGIKADPARNGDRSNSQFAILALHSAVACGIEVPREVWEEVIKEVIGGQEGSGPPTSLTGSKFSAGSLFAREEEDREDEDPDGTRVRPNQNSQAGTKTADKARGWAYANGRRPNNGAGYGSMTAAGVSSLAVAREALGGEGTQDPALRGTLQALRDGLAWLARSFDVTTNPGKEGHYFYWLYSLEKAMDTTGVERLATHEWWRAAAAELLTRQQPNGSWGSIEDTSLALLVLNRATLPAQLEIEAITRKATGEAKGWDSVAVEGVGRLGLRQLLDTMADRPEIAAKRLDLAQKALEQLDTEVQPRLVKRLAKLTESKHKATRRWASKTCKQLAGTDDPDEVAAFSKTYESLRRAGETRDPARIGIVRSTLADDDAPWMLRRQALVVASRMRAVEALPDVVDQLLASKKDERSFAWDCLVSLAGGEQRPYDPQASARKRQDQVAEWQDWVRSKRESLLRKEQLRRALDDLGRDGARGDAAVQALRERGEEAWPHLADALLDAAKRKRAHSLLKSMTKANLPAEAQAWRDWLAGDRTVAARPRASTSTDTTDEDDPTPAATRREPKSAAGRERWGLVPRPSQQGRR